jgi:hypothetical protein
VVIFTGRGEASGFAVRSARSADAECEFSYRVTAKHKDAADVRFEFEEAQEPEGKTFRSCPRTPRRTPAECGRDWRIIRGQHPGVRPGLAALRLSLDQRKHRSLHGISAG